MAKRDIQKRKKDERSEVINKKRKRDEIVKVISILTVLNTYNILFFGFGLIIYIRDVIYMFLSICIYLVLRKIIVYKLITHTCMYYNSIL